MKATKIILRNKKISLLALILFAFTVCVHAQKETEVFIPIGKSPGVSGKHSIMGKVESVNVSDSTMSIRQETGIKTLKMTEQTKIYLDKSKLNQQNKKGNYTDLRTGMTTEIKYVDNKPGNPIDWIKVAIE